MFLIASYFYVDSMFHKYPQFPLFQVWKDRMKFWKPQKMYGELLKMFIKYIL